MRQFADTQFRFVAGFAGAGTESIQSVHFPNRYVRISGTTVRIDPVESGGTWAAQASFRRTRTTTGTTVQSPAGLT